MFRSPQFRKPGEEGRPPGGHTPERKEGGTQSCKGNGPVASGVLAGELAGLQGVSRRRCVFTVGGIRQAFKLKGESMSTNARRTLGLAFVVALIAGGAFWASSSLSAAPGKPMLPTKE